VSRSRSRIQESPALIAVALALAIALAGTALAGPTTLKDITKSKVKSIASDVADREIQEAAPGLSVANATNATNADTAGVAGTAGDATTLGGKGPDDYVGRQQLVSAVVAPANQNAQIVSSQSRLAGSVKYLQTGLFDVTFDRNITNCAATVTYGTTAGGSAATPYFVSIRGPADSNPFTIGVAVNDATGALVNDSRGFQMNLVCTS
jgi:hypothetical protein